MKKIYIQAFLIWCFYSLFTKWLLIKGAAFSTPIIFAFASNFLSGAFFASIFLYFFNHEEFFKFAKSIEKIEIKKEKKLTRSFARFGGLFSVILITVISGPLLSALSAKFLIGKSEYKYFIVAFFSGASAILIVAALRGVVRLPF